MNKGVYYFRVSTQRQGISGLGLNGQRAAVQNFTANGDWQVIGEFTEIESGKVKDRPQLMKALELCHKEKATLLIAKLDRLSRNAAFLLNLQESGVRFTCVDMPFADNFTISIMGLVAQKEREMISERTRAALAAVKRNGNKKLGNPQYAKAVKIARKIKTEIANERALKVAPIIQQIQRAHVTSLTEIARCLNARGFQTPNGKQYAPQSVKNLLERIQAQQS